MTEELNVFFQYIQIAYVFLFIVYMIQKYSSQ